MSADTQVYHSHAKKYWLVFVLLTVLTIAELIAAESAAFSYSMKAISLTVLAIGKAVAVAYWYMHLDEEKGWLRFIAAIPISAAIYAAALILESVYR
jgi:cytochrome c oxidase subunit 4